MDVKIGSTVTVEITGRPRNAAAQKTLCRLCRKDPTVVRRTRNQDRKRPSWEQWRRGGRQWHHQMKSGPGVSLNPGSKYSLFASLDVVRDLASVGEWVKVTG